MSRVKIAILIGGVLVIGLAWALVVVTSGSTSAQPEASASCLVPAGGGPGYGASISNRQDGKTICIKRGERLAVFLSTGQRTGSPWSSIQLSRPGILRVAPLTLMLSRGVTAKNFLAVSSGRVRLTSQHPACGPPAPGQATCNAIQLWQVVIIVRP